jgi:hypothetical protein
MKKLKIYLYAFFTAFALLLVMQIPTRATDTYTDHIVGYWSFDECDANIVLNRAEGKDADGNKYSGYTGFNNGGQKVNGYNDGNTSHGYWGFGYYFDGNSYIDFGDIKDYNFDFSLPFTIAAWVKPDKYDDFGDFIGKMTSPGSNYKGWGLGAGGRVLNGHYGNFRFDLNDSWTDKAIYLDVDGYPYDNDNGYADGKWHFIVATYSAEHFNDKNNPGTPSALDLIVYIDGSIVSDNQISRTTNGAAENMVNTAKFRIGHRSANFDDSNRGYHGAIDEVYLFNSALSSDEQSALYTSYTGEASGQYCQASDNGLVLWYEPGIALDNNGNLILTDNVAVKTWPDQTETKENATMSDLNRQPVWLKNGMADGIPGVQFTYDYAAADYGKSDILTSPYNSEITSVVPDIFNPSQTPKTLVVEFKTGNHVNEYDQNGSLVENPPYYSDGRQTIFEAGGPMSGFNIYISHGYLCYGMWNYTESKFIKYDSKGDYYPLSGTTAYIAIIEYNPDHLIDGSIVPSFRAALSKAGATDAVYSDWVPFSGLLYDATGVQGGDLTGIGGASRTQYYDYNTGETYSDHFGGVIGEVWLYNDVFNGTTRPQFYQTVNNITGLDFPTPPDESSQRISDNWQYFQNNLVIDSDIHLNVYPNPFNDKATLQMSIPENMNASVELFNVLGERVALISDGTLSKGYHEMTIDGSTLNSGLYIFKVSGNGFVQTGTVVLSK